MLRPLAPDIWSLDRQQPMPGGFHMPLRMTVVRLSDGGLWLHSPVALTDEEAAAIEALGPVRHLVAPNLYHHLHIGKAIARWPQATTWLAPGLPAKRKDLRADNVLGDLAPPAWAGQLDQVAIKGAPSVNEVVFFHRATGTLLVTDLVFNIPTLDSFVSRTMFSMLGVLGRFNQSRSWQLLFIKDRPAAQQSARSILGWPVRRVVPAHGDVVEERAAEQLAAALAKMAAAA